MTARLFLLVRHTDVSGVSGTGVVAEGIEYEDGGIALRWKGEWPATAVWPNMESLLKIHGHDGKTTVRYLDTAAGSAGLLLAGAARGIPFISMEIRDQSQVHASTADAWRLWVEHLGGSVDAAHRSELDSTYFPWRWDWISPDGAIRIFHLTTNPDEIQLEAG